MNKFFGIIFSLFLVCNCVFGLEYDYSSTKCIPIRLCVLESIDSEEELIEGSEIKLKVIETVFSGNKKILSRGDIVTGKVETLITPGMNGFPAEIILDNVDIPNVKQSQLQGIYISKGQNRCFWVYPLKWALTPIPFVGSLTNLIMGGHAKIKTDDIITVYYYPEWK